MMSTMSMASNLNPNAPLFIPAAYQQVEDFSPQWWELVKTTGWFRDHWFRQHQEQETFDGEEDVASLLPDSFDLGIDGEFSESELLDEAAAYGFATGTYGFKENGLESNAEAVMKSLISPRNGGGPRLTVEPAKYSEKPGRHASPKFSPRRIIQQPR